MTEEDDFVSVLEEPYDSNSDEADEDYIISADLRHRQSNIRVQPKSPINEESYWRNRNSNARNSSEDPLLETTQEEGSTSNFPKIDWDKISKRIRYYVPITGWLPRYQIRKHFLFDFISGITVGFLLVPQSLSYAHGLAKLPPLVGLMTAIVSTIVYSFFGTSRQLSVGPEALVSIMTGMAVESFRKRKFGSTVLSSSSNCNATFATGGGGAVDPSIVLSFASAIALAVGLLSLLMGLLRLGFIDGVFSKSLLAGFIGAVAIVIEIEQLPNLLKLPSSETSIKSNSSGGGGGESSPLEKLAFIIGNIGETHVASLLLSLTSITFLFVSNFMKKRFPLHCRYIPGTITLVLGTTLASSIWDWRSNWQILTLEDIENTNEESMKNWIKWPLTGLDKGDVQDAFSTAILITIIGFIESVVAGKKYAQKFSYNISANRELVAFGLMNLVSSMFHAYPSFGSLSRTVVNANSKTQMSGIVTGTFLIVTLTFLIPYIQSLPQTVMSSVIFMAALELFEWEELAFMWKIRAIYELVGGFGSALVTLAVSIEAGVVTSMICSVILVLKHSMYPRFTLMGQVLVEEEEDESIIDEQGNQSHVDKVNLEQEQDKSVDIKIKEEPLTFKPENMKKANLKVHVNEQFDQQQPGPPSSLSFSSPSFSSSSQQKNSNNNNILLESPPSNDGSRKPATRHRQIVRKFKPLSEYPHARKLDRILIITLHESLFFGNTAQLQSRLQRLEATGELGIHPSEPSRLVHPVQHVILDLENVVAIDASATKVLLDLAQDYRSREIGLYFVKCRNALKPLFIRSGLLDVVGAHHFFRKVGDALHLIQELEDDHRQNHGDIIGRQGVRQLNDVIVVESLSSFPEKDNRSRMSYSSYRDI